MDIRAEQLRVSASDLAKHLACRHLTSLDLKAARGEIDRVYRDDPSLAVLAERGFLKEPAVRRGGNQDLRDRYAAHQAMITNFRITLCLATRDRHDVELPFFQRESLTLRDRVTIPKAGGPHTYPINPDGFFGLRFPELPEGRNRAFFFLEADRSTMTGRRFVAKLLGYAHWRADGGHTRKLGIKGFRVLTVTTSEARMRNLAGLAARTDALRDTLALLWFTAEARFTPKDPQSFFSPIWETPDRLGERQKLLP